MRACGAGIALTEEAERQYLAWHGPPSWGTSGPLPQGSWGWGMMDGGAGRLGRGKSARAAGNGGRRRRSLPHPLTQSVCLSVLLDGWIQKGCHAHAKRALASRRLILDSRGNSRSNTAPPITHGSALPWKPPLGNCSRSSSSRRSRRSAEIRSGRRLGWASSIRRHPTRLRVSFRALISLSLHRSLQVCAAGWLAAETGARERGLEAGRLAVACLGPWPRKVPMPGP